MIMRPKLLIHSYKSKRIAEKNYFSSLSDEEKNTYNARKNFIVDNIAAYIIISICAGSYLAGLLNYSGVSVEYNGLILSIPVLSTFFQFFGAIISKKIKSQKKMVVIGIGFQRIALAMVFFYPLITGPGTITIVLVVITYALAFFVGTAAGPASGNWLINFVPQNIRGGYFSKREKYSLLGIAISTVFTGIVLDKSQEAGYFAWGFALIGVFLLSVAIIDIVHLMKIHEVIEDKKKSRIGIHSILEPLKDKTYIKVIIMLIFWQLSTQIAIPFLGIYYIETIGMEYTLIGIVTLVITFEKAVIVSRWGRFADRTSWDFVLKIAVLIYAVSKIMLIFLSPSNYLWMFPFSMIVGNIAWSVLGISLINIQFQYANPDNMVIYIGVSGSLSGISGFMAALAGAKILSVFKGKDLIVNGNQFLLILSSLFALTLTYYIHKSMKHPDMLNPFRKIKSKMILRKRN